MFRPIVFVAFCSIAGIACTGIAQKAAIAAPAAARPQAPLQTELIVPLDITHVHSGTPVLARVISAWGGADCRLPAGSMVRGHVVDLTKRSKTEKSSKISLLFDGADCRGNPEASHRFTLVALIGGLRSTGQSGVTEAPPLSNDLPQSLGGSGGSGFRGVSEASAIVGNFGLQAHKLPSTILPGQVIDIEKTRLELDGGPEGETNIVAAGRNVRLEAGTMLILTLRAPTVNAPREAATAPDALSAKGSTQIAAVGAKTLPAVASPQRPPEPRDETEICAGACTQLTVEDRAATAVPSHAAAQVALRQLGYARPSPREVEHFGADTTVTYLTDRLLLCTFDLHRLRERLGADEETAHTVRAVVVDVPTHAVVRVLDWRVRGDGQYLWRLPQGHVLLHTGHELRELDAALKTQRSLPIEGRLAWVVSSPSGKYLAVGTIRERYSMRTRLELEEVLPEDAEEDVQVRVFDSKLALLLTALRSSHSPPPVLSDEGELRLTRVKAGRWRLHEARWDRSERQIAVITSACRPTLSTPGSQLIFVVGCTGNGGRWYRVLHEGGQTVLKAEYLPGEIEQAAEPGAPGSFAVRVVKTKHPLAQDAPFRPADLELESIALYNGGNGKRLHAVSSPDFAMSKLGFAVSPGGDQLAVAGGAGVSFYFWGPGLTAGPAVPPASRSLEIASHD